MSGTEINNLMNWLKLGAVIEEPIQVTGGLLHKMYRVNTNNDTYAVKVLNTEIMKRSVAFQNTVNSEKIAARLQSVIPVVSALEIGGRQIHEWNRAYYMIFDW